LPIATEQCALETSKKVVKVYSLGKILSFIVITNYSRYGKVKSAYEPNWLIRPELIPVSVALSD